MTGRNGGSGEETAGKRCNRCGRVLSLDWFQGRNGECALCADCRLYSRLRKRETDAQAREEARNRQAATVMDLREVARMDALAMAPLGLVCRPGRRRWNDAPWESVWEVV